MNNFFFSYFEVILYIIIIFNYNNTLQGLLSKYHLCYRSETNPSSFRAVVGTSFRTSGGDAYDLSKVYVHESYSSLTLVHDIAMIVTNRQMDLGKNIYPISFAEPTISIPVRKTAVVSGFGMTSVSSNGLMILVVFKNIIALKILTSFSTLCFTTLSVISHSINMFFLRPS